MWRLRLLYLGHRHVRMRPDSFLVLSAMIIIVVAGVASLRLSPENPALITLGTGLVVSAMQLTAMLQFPGIADGLSWGGLIIEELKSTRGVVPDAGLGAARRRIVRHLQEHGDVPEEVVQAWLRASYP